MYQTLRALESDKFDNRLVRACFEIKAVALQGEFPGVRNNTTYLKDTLLTLDHILKIAPVKLYGFSVSDEVLDELISIGKDTIRHCVDATLKSAELLDSLM